MTEDVKPVASNVEVKDEKVVAPVAENQVLEEAKKEEEKVRDKLAKNISGKVKAFAKNIIKGEKSDVSKPDLTIQSPTTKKPFSISKLLKIAGIMVLVAVIIFGLYVKFIWKKTSTKNVVNLPPSPTFSPYEKFKPSVYADEPVVKKLEESMNVLNSEMSTTPLGETTLTPPVLDFEIKFK
jgi:hypothetical protein